MTGLCTVGQLTMDACLLTMGHDLSGITENALGTLAMLKRMRVLAISKAYREVWSMWGFGKCSLKRR